MGRRPGRGRSRREQERDELDERVVDIKRVATVVKGGRRFSFRVVCVVGDNQGKVGVGVGKARGVPDAIRKALDKARRTMVEVPIVGTTIPHQTISKYGGARVLLKPASPGTGVIAGGAVRAVLEVAGIQNVLTKSLGTTNPHNVVKATFDALLQLKDPDDVAKRRGKELKEFYYGPTARV